MGDRTGIQWSDATWNPVAGCSILSPGCTNCYAQRMAGRLERMGVATYQGLTRKTKAGDVWTGEIRVAPGHMLSQPMRWKRPRRVFVNSMSDLFHENLPFGQVMRVWEVMWRAPRHIYQVLTKRTARMAEFVERWADTNELDPRPKLAHGPVETRTVHTCGRAMLFADMLDAMGDPPPGCAYPTYDWMGGMCTWPLSADHISLGFSAERQAEFDARWADMRRVAALGWPVFVSAEPLLGGIILPPDFLALGERAWVIVGGESGHGARPMRREWAESLLRQCEEAGVAAFFKQIGSNRPESGDWSAKITGKGDNPAEWSDDMRVQRFPNARGTMFEMLHGMGAVPPPRPAEVAHG